MNKFIKISVIASSLFFASETILARAAIANGDDFQFTPGLGLDYRIGESLTAFAGGTLSYHIPSSNAQIDFENRLQYDLFNRTWGFRSILNTNIDGFNLTGEVLFPFLLDDPSSTRERFGLEYFDDKFALEVIGRSANFELQSLEGTFNYLDSNQTLSGTYQYGVVDGNSRLIFDYRHILEDNVELNATWENTWDGILPSGGSLIGSRLSIGLGYSSAIGDATIQLDADLLEPETPVDITVGLDIRQFPLSIKTSINLGDTNFNIASELKTKTTPEPTSTLSLLALGTVGAVSTLKRKQKSKSPEKQTV